MNRPTLWSGKHSTTGVNVQVACDLGGRLVRISNPVDGHRHDTVALRASGVLEGMKPENWFGDVVATFGCTVPSMDGLHRRTIVKGAAWTVPAVAVPLAAPPPPRRTPRVPVPPASACALSSTQGNIQVVTEASTRNGSKGSAWFDYIEPAANTGNVGSTFATTITVKAGQVLTFSLSATASRGTGGKQDPTAPIEPCLWEGPSRYRRPPGSLIALTSR